MNAPGGAAPQQLAVDAAARARQKGQSPRVVWITGLPGAGKSTLACALDQALFRRGRHSFVLDGDNLRRGLSRDLGFGGAERDENIRRAAQVARLMLEAGLIVLVAMISPHRAERRVARGLFAPGEFLEVYLSTPLEVCERRDPKGMYRMARAGRIAEFTGVSAPYEAPEHAELVLDTSRLSVAQCVRSVLGALESGAPVRAALG